MLRWTSGCNRAFQVFEDSGGNKVFHDSKYEGVGKVKVLYRDSSRNKRPNKTNNTSKYKCKTLTATTSFFTINQIAANSLQTAQAGEQALSLNNQICRAQKPRDDLFCILWFAGWSSACTGRVDSRQRHTHQVEAERTSVSPPHYWTLKELNFGQHKGGEHKGQ